MSQHAIGGGGARRALWAVPAAILALIVWLFGALLALQWFFSSASTFLDQFPDSGADGTARFAEIGSSAWILVIAYGIAGIGGPLIAVGLLVERRAHRWAWAAPLAALALCWVAVLVASLTFQPPPLPPNGG